MDMKKDVVGKKGQQLTLGTIILIILGVVVLVFLIFGFSQGWSNFWEKITGIGGGDVNVDTIKTSCTLACSTQSENAFCDEKRIVKFSDGEGGIDKITRTCDELIGEELVNVGLDDCPAITCS